MKKDLFQTIIGVVTNKKFIIAVVAIVLIVALKFSFTSKNNSEDKWVKGEDYSWSLAGVNIYSATAEELVKLSSVTYGQNFGEVEDEQKAYEIAARIIDGLYGDCSEEEAPFVITFNSVANAWIVHGTVEDDSEGCAVTAINKSTGEIYLLRHDK